MRHRLDPVIQFASVLLLLLVCLMSCSESDAGIKVAGIVFQEDQFFRLVQFGMKEVAENEDVAYFFGNSYNRPDKEIQLVNTYLARGVDAVIISPLSNTASITALKRANERGVTVITYNTTVSSDIPAAHIESNQEDLGRRTGEKALAYIEEKLNGKAKVAILAFKSQAAEQSDARSNGFKEALKKLPGVRIVAEQDAWLPEMAVKKAGDILTAHPDLDIIWAANEGGTVGSVMAVKNTGRAEKVAVFGTDTSEQLIGFLLSEDGILKAITGQRPFEIGTRAMEAALNVLRKEPHEGRLLVPGILLSRDDPEGVKAFAKELKERIARGNQ